MEQFENETPHRILIVEDKISTAERLNIGINKHTELAVAGMAYDVTTGLKLLAKLKPRIVLVDLGLPDGSGNEVIEAVQKSSWICDAIVISIFGDEERALSAIRAGAKGYVLKNDLNDNITQQILEVIDGGSPISPKIARLLLGHIPVQSEEKAEKNVLNLTPRETEILNLLAKGFRRQEIADKFGISVGTVGVHVNRIYEKLNVRSNVEAIKYANAELQS